MPISFNPVSKKSTGRVFLVKNKKTHSKATNIQQDTAFPRDPLSLKQETRVVLNIASITHGMFKSSDENLQAVFTEDNIGDILSVASGANEKRIKELISDPNSRAGKAVDLNDTQTITFNLIHTDIIGITGTCNENNISDVNCKNFCHLLDGANSLDYFPIKDPNPKPTNFDVNQGKALSILVEAFYHSDAFRDLINSGKLKPEADTYFRSSVQATNSQVFKDAFGTFLKSSKSVIYPNLADRIIRVFENKMEVIVTENNDIICALRGVDIKVGSEIVGVGLLYDNGINNTNAEANVDNTNVSSTSNVSVNQEETGIAAFLKDKFGIFLGWCNSFFSSNSQVSVESSTVVSSSKSHTPNNQLQDNLASVINFIRDEKLITDESKIQELEGFLGGIIADIDNAPKYHAAIFLLIKAVKDEQFKEFKYLLNYFLDESIPDEVLNTENEKEKQPEKKLHPQQRIFLEQLEKLSKIVYSTRDQDIITKFEFIICNDSKTFSLLMQENTGNKVEYKVIKKLTEGDTDEVLNILRKFTLPGDTNQVNSHSHTQLDSKSSSSSSSTTSRQSTQ